MKAFIQILEAFRDLFLSILPKSIVSIFFDGEFAFICHPLDVKDSVRKYPFTKGMSVDLFELWTKNFWPIIGAPIYGSKKYNGEQVKGWAVICPLPPAIMVKDPDLARRMIIRTARLCEKMGVKLVALGGYNSIITHDGEDLVGKTSLAVTTGNTYSALLVIENIKKVSEELSLDLKSIKVGIIGAAGSVGSACAQIIPQMVQEVWLMDRNKKGLKDLHELILTKSSNVKIFDSMDFVKELDLIVTATSTPAAIIHGNHIRAGMIFIDAAQPKNILEELTKRQDVLIIDSGIGKVPYLACDMEMGPYRNEVYACLGEALALTANGTFLNYSIGKVKPEKVFELADILRKAGFEVPQFRNASGYISQEWMQVFKNKLKTDFVK